MRPRVRRWAAVLCVTAGVMLAAGVLMLHAAEEKAEDRADEPMSPGGTVPVPRASLLKENSRLIDVEGLILDMRDDLKISPVHRAVFQPRDGLGYFILLENLLLEKTLKQTAHGERPVRVRGTITVFRGKNYLLLDWAAVKGE